MIIIEGQALNAALNHISNMAAVHQRYSALKQSDRENRRLHQHYAKERELERERLQLDRDRIEGELAIRETLAENDTIRANSDALRARTYAKVTDEQVNQSRHRFQQGILQTQSEAVDRAHSLLQLAKVEYTMQTGQEAEGKQFDQWLDTEAAGDFQGLNKDIVTLHNSTIPVRKAMAKSAGRVGENAESSRVVRDGNGNYVYVAKDKNTGEVLVKTPSGEDSSKNPNQDVSSFSLDSLLVRTGSALAPYGATPAFINARASQHIYNLMTDAERAEFNETKKIPQSTLDRLDSNTGQTNGTPEDSAVAALVTTDPVASESHIGDASAQSIAQPEQVATEDNPPPAASVQQTHARQEAEYNDEQQTTQGLAGYVPVDPTLSPSGAANRQPEPSVPPPAPTVQSTPVPAATPTPTAPISSTVTPIDQSGWSQAAKDDWAAQNPPATTASGLRREPHRNWFGKTLDKVYDRVGTAVERINTGQSTPVSATGSPPPTGTYLGGRARSKVAEVVGEYPGVQNENEYVAGPIATSPLTQNYGPVESRNVDLNVARGLLQQGLANTYRQRGMTTSGDFMEGQSAFSLSGQHLSDNPTVAAQQRKALQIKEQQKFEQEFGVPETTWVPAADGKLVPQETGRRIPTSHGYTEGENFEYHTRKFANAYVRSKLKATDETKYKRLEKELGDIIENYQPGNVEQIQALVYDVYKSNPEKYFREIPGIRSLDVSTWNNKQKQRLFDVITEELTQPGVLGEIFDRVHRVSFFNEKIRRNTIPREGLSQGVRADLYKYRSGSGEPAPEITSGRSALERMLIPELR